MPYSSIARTALGCRLFGWLPALAAVIVGGVGSIGGTLAGALLIGIAESAAVHLGAAEWRQVISFALIILVLCLRPAGLFGRRS